MAVAKKTKTTRGQKQDRARVAGGQNYEVQCHRWVAKVHTLLWSRPRKNGE